MDHPMLKITLVFAAGILLDHLLPLPLLIWMLSFWAMVCCFISLKESRSVSLAIMLVTSGASLHALHTRPINPSDVRYLEIGEGWYVTIEGVLTETPRLKIHQVNGAETRSSLATVKVLGMAHESSSSVISGNILVRTSGALPDSFYKGIRVRITGVLSSPPRPVADGLFDYQTFLQHKGIHRILYADAPQAWTIHANGTQGPTRPWTDRFREWAMDALSYGLPELDDATKLRWAMVLGLKTWLHEDMIEPFRWSGSMHLFAISGLHVAMVTGLMLAGLQMVIRSRWLAGLFVLVAMWCYVAITGWQTSAIRAGIMTTIILSGWMLKKPHSMLNSLFTAAWVVLIWQPTQLFQIGFQLSFAVVLGLVTLADPIRKLIERRFLTDPWILSDQLTRFQLARNWSVRKMASAVSISLAAWLGSLPIIWQHFHLMTPIGLFGNLLMIPLAGATISCAMGSLMCITWAPGLTELFNHSGWFWMESMVRMSEWMATLPMAYFYVSPFPVPILWYYYGFLILLALGLHKNSRKQWIVFACGVMGSLLLLGHMHQTWTKQEITFMPVANGDAIWVNQSGLRNDALMDGGNARAAQRITQPFLESRGVDRLNELWISHGDADHIGGSKDLMHHFQPKRALSANVEYRSPYFRELLEMAKRGEMHLDRIAGGQSFGELEVLHPSKRTTAAKADDANLVLRFKWGDCRIILAGDLSREGMIVLSNQYPKLKADILVINRPKESVPPNVYWMDSLQPQLILVTGITLGRKDRWVDALRQHSFRSNPSIWDTGTHGSVRLEEIQGTIQVISNQGKSRTIHSRGSSAERGFVQFLEWDFQISPL